MHFSPGPASGSAHPENCREVEQLYANGEGGGIAFSPCQLQTSFFCGIRRNGELVAVAGVQVWSQQEGVAAVRNIFTREAVVTSLKEAAVPTIGLNVDSTNSVAIRAYEHIGFRTHFSYFEGIADKFL